MHIEHEFYKLLDDKQANRELILQDVKSQGVSCREFFTLRFERTPEQELDSRGGVYWLEWKIRFMSKPYQYMDLESQEVYKSLGGLIPSEQEVKNE